MRLNTCYAAKFPIDEIEPVPKGEFGGDVLHRVIGSGGHTGGTILWETKRTRNWSDVWLIKLREDQRAAKAEIAVIVTQTLPKGVETFEMLDGVWVTHPARPCQSRLSFVTHYWNSRLRANRPKVCKPKRK